VTGVWTRRSFIELTARAPGEIRTPTLQVRSLAQLSVVLPEQVPAPEAEPGPPPCHGGALPLSYAGLATPTGFEPVPSTLTGWRTGLLC
jgi:hypothetical protein